VIAVRPQEIGEALDVPYRRKILPNVGFDKGVEREDEKPAVRSCKAREAGEGLFKAAFHRFPSLDAAGGMRASAREARPF
jgi:hypothetical protein